MNPFSIDLANERRQALLDQADEARRANLSLRHHPRWVRRWRHAGGTAGTNR